ncbi:putative copi vesicle coat beta [Phaeomoniella chlamydospora]|uniref:Coatomer subunit beta' n=1 Tax=Phaeomoniella chlamydospora TaxID=158046 RepID=A0A0G2EFB3_PHACM|nr:putative copi vesicle coat beta [Phaeomoniella chlamydospora]
MRLDVKRQLLARSNRVKSIALHQDGDFSLVKTFDLTDVPVRACCFVERKNWVIGGSDDFKIRVYNYNTSAKVTEFEAHPDYIRSVVVHPTLPYLLTASDDMTIKLWEFDSWRCLQTFESHAHYVMSIAINPKDTNQFASACLDRTVRVWDLSSPRPRFTIDAHETKGVNYVSYYPGGDKPHILTSSDDRSVRIYDYQTKQMVASLEGHTSNVSFAVYHNTLPLIISGSEDGTVKLWNATTFTLEQTLNYGLERAWCVATHRAQQNVALGFDDGAVVVKMGRDEPAVSMDNSGKIVFARQSEVLSSLIKGGDSALKDAEPLSLPTKELGRCDFFPQTLSHSPNGRFVASMGDGEYVVYTALAWRSKAFGSALDFAWGENSNDYAIRESATSVKVFLNFKEKSGGVDVGYSADGLSGGVLLGVKGQGGIGFFDWQTGSLVRRIEVEPKTVYWSANGELVALCCEETFYVLRFSREAYLEGVNNGTADEDGVEDAFEIVTDINETVVSGVWVGDSFVYSTSSRLSYLVGDQTNTISTFDSPQFILGYLPRDGRLYLTSKDFEVISFALPLSVVEYQTLVLRGDLDSAQSLLPDIPADQTNKIARFLEGQGYKSEALEVATDPEHRFELALSLSNLAVALEIAKEVDQDHKWKTVGDAALAAWDLALAEECFVNAKDIGSLLLLYSSSGNSAGLKALAEQADAVGANNVAFSALWTASDVDASIELLLKTNRAAEAVLFAQTYKPSAASNLAKLWKEGLEQQGKSKVAKLIGVPEEDTDLFPEWDEYLTLEKQGGSSTNGTGKESNLIDTEDVTGEDANGTTNGETEEAAEAVEPEE